MSVNNNPEKIKKSVVPLVNKTQNEKNMKRRSSKEKKKREVSKICLEKWPPLLSYLADKQDDSHCAAERLRKLGDQFYENNIPLFEEVFDGVGEKESDTCLFCYVRVILNPSLAEKNDDQYECPICDVDNIDDDDDDDC